MEQKSLNEIPTAEEFLKVNTVPFANGEDDELFDRVAPSDLIQFAKLHVEAALRKASEEANIEYEPHWSGEQEDCVYINKESILNSYPLTNIK